MNTYTQGTKAHEAAQKMLDSGDAAAMVRKLGKLESAEHQLAYIDTMYKILSSDRSYMRYGANVTAVQIRNQQRERVAQWGDKAYGLSEAQLGVVARDLASLAATKETEEA